MTGTAAFVRTGRLDILSANQLGYALYAPVFLDPVQPVNLARFIFLTQRSPTSTATATASPTLPSVACAPKPDPTRTTGRCPIWSASYPPAAKSSGCAGPRTT
jgi:hypothetical protein